MAITLTNPTYYVDQTETSDGRRVWQVNRCGAKRFCASGLNNKDAVAEGRRLAKKNKGILKVYSTSGDLRSEVSYS